MFFRHLYLAVWAYWGAVELRLINMDERIAVGTRYFAVDPALGCALAEEGYPLVPIGTTHSQPLVLLVPIGTTHTQTPVGNTKLSVQMNPSQVPRPSCVDKKVS